jgi:glutamyl-tRNA reductase
MQDFILVHRKQNGNPLVLNVPTWTTCLRQIAFFKSWELEEAKNQIKDVDQIFEGHQALQFLIQVVCGLQSSLIGETEVHGQFKKFIVDHPELKNLGDAILVAAKKVRSDHLIDLGSQSYGSYIRKKLKSADSISLVGAGMLTQEILPWLKKMKQVDLHVRNLQKVEALKSQFPFIQIKSLQEKILNPVLVLAAPIDNSIAIEILNMNVKTVFDLRGGQILDSFNQKLNYESLPVIMEQIQRTQVVLRTKLEASETAIHQVAEEILKKLWLRPGGWEDLCG